VAVLYLKGYWEPIEITEEIEAPVPVQEEIEVVTRNLRVEPRHPGDAKYRLPEPVPEMLGSVSPSRYNLTKKAMDSFNNENYESAAVLFAELSKHDGRAFVGLGLSYYKLGDYRSAARFLEEALDEKGVDEFQVRKFLAFTYYEMDDLQESLNNALVALSIRKDDDLDGLVSRLKREKPEQEDFIYEETLHFKVIFDGHEHGLVSRQVLDILEGAYGIIGTEMGYYPKKPVTVILYSEQDFYDVTRLPEWSGGLFDGKIRLPLRGVDEYESEVLRKVLYHEYAHALVFSITPRCPVWVNEGLAMYLSGEERQKVGQEISIRTLEGSFPRSPRQGRLAYDVSYSAVSYLVQNYGLYSFRIFLNALAEGQDVEGAFKSAFLISYDEFTESWGMT
jgi:hypothetical protein